MAQAQPKVDNADAPLVLIVDDEESICETLASVFEDESFRTCVASNGEEGINLARDLRPDLVFLDIWMPGLDGIATLEQLKESCPETEVVMMSGHATISNALEAVKRGAFDLIEKPLDIESLLLAAKTALKNRKSSVNTNSAVVNPVISGETANELGSMTENFSALGTHPGICSLQMAGRNIGQRTLKESIVLYGHCLHSGMKSGLVLQPLPANSGIHFAQMGGPNTAPAYVSHVESTTLATTVRSGAVAVSTIEHLMSALHAYKISNLLIKCNGEVPVFDGSSIEFCETIESVGIQEQEGDWFELAIDEPITFDSGSERITLEPADELSVHYTLKYPAPVGLQEFEYVCSGVESFKKEIAPARTFGFISDVERMQRAGLAAGGRLNNFILIGNEGIVNTDLRFPEELVRHKILDAIGDLFLIGRPLRCRIVAQMTGHSDNAQVLRLLAEKMKLPV